MFQNPASEQGLLCQDIQSLSVPDSRDVSRFYLLHFVPLSAR